MLRRYFINPVIAVIVLFAVFLADAVIIGQQANVNPGIATTSAPAYSNNVRVALSLDTSGNLRITCVSGCGGSGGTSAVDNSVFTGGTTSVTPAGALYDTTPPAVTDGNVGVPRMNSNRQIMVDCQVGCSGSSFADNSAFTFGTTAVTIVGAVVDDTATVTVAENSAAAPRMNTNRIMYMLTTDATGTATGTAGAPYRTDPTGTTTQPVSGTVTVTDGAGALNVIVDSGTTAVTQATATNLNAAVVGTGTAGAPAGNILTVQGVGGMTKLLVTPDSVALPANQSVNVAQINGVTTTMGNGVSGTGVQRVTIASDSTGQVTLATGSNTIGALTANQSVNVAQMNGVATTMGNGVSGTGVQRVTIASDSTGQITLATGANTIGALTANQSVNTAQINGVAPAMGNGVSGTGVQRVTIASDSTGQVALAAGSATIGALTANQSVNYTQMAGSTVVADPCKVNAKVYTLINVTANTQLITGTASKKTYICALNIVVAAATNVAIVSGTGSVCATSTVGNISGGTTAATGWNFAANGGIALGNGDSTISATTVNADNLCILVSAANQTSGSIVSVVQ